MQLKTEMRHLLARREEYETANTYYEGEASEVFGAAALAKAIRRTGYKTNLNFCRPIVEAVKNRLELSAVLGVSDAANKVISDSWEFNQLYIDANEIHRAALVYGDCYAMVWPDEDGNVEISYSTPVNTVIIYDETNPRKKKYGVKMWEVENGHRLNIYGPDKIVKYSTDSKSVTEGTNWTITDAFDNPFGDVPMFHFRTHRPFGRPEHKDGYEAQNYINKQLIQSMFTADFQGAPQRWALSETGEGSAVEDFDESETDRENIAGLKNNPGEVWFLKNIKQVGQFQPADPAVFWEPIKNTVRAMASTTNTPLHYFEKTGNVPSGQALRVAEAPLIKKVNDRKASFGQTWRDLFAFVLVMNGIDEDVEVKWKEIESLDELERLDAALKKRNIGISTAQVMREMGYDNEVIERVLEEARQEIADGTAGYQRAAITRVQEQNDERNQETITD